MKRTWETKIFKEITSTHKSIKQAKLGSQKGKSVVKYDQTQSEYRKQLLTQCNLQTAAKLYSHRLQQALTECSLNQVGKP